MSVNTPVGGQNGRRRRNASLNAMNFIRQVTKGSTSMLSTDGAGSMRELHVVSAQNTTVPACPASPTASQFEDPHDTFAALDKLLEAARILQTGESTSAVKKGEIESTPAVKKGQRQSTPAIKKGERPSTPAVKKGEQQRARQRCLGVPVRRGMEREDGEMDHKPCVPRAQGLHGGAPDARVKFESQYDFPYYAKADKEKGADLTHEKESILSQERETVSEALREGDSMPGTKVSSPLSMPACSRLSNDLPRLGDDWEVGPLQEEGQMEASMEEEVMYFTAGSTLKAETVREADHLYATAWNREPFSQREPVSLITPRPATPQQYSIQAAQHAPQHAPQQRTAWRIAATGHSTQHSSQQEQSMHVTGSSKGTSILPSKHAMHASSLQPSLKRPHSIPMGERDLYCFTETLDEPLSNIPWPTEILSGGHEPCVKLTGELCIAHSRPAIPSMHPPHFIPHGMHASMPIPLTPPSLSIDMSHYGTRASLLTPQYRNIQERHGVPESRKRNALPADYLVSSNSAESDAVLPLPKHLPRHRRPLSRPLQKRAGLSNVLDMEQDSVSKTEQAKLGERDSEQERQRCRSASSRRERRSKRQEDHQVGPQHGFLGQRQGDARTFKGEQANDDAYFSPGIDREPSDRLQKPSNTLPKPSGTLQSSSIPLQKHSEHPNPWHKKVEVQKPGDRPFHCHRGPSTAIGNSVEGSLRGMRAWNPIDPQEKGEKGRDADAWSDGDDSGKGRGDRGDNAKGIHYLLGSNAHYMDAVQPAEGMEEKRVVVLTREKEVTSRIPAQHHNLRPHTSSPHSRPRVPSMPIRKPTDPLSLQSRPTDDPKFECLSFNWRASQSITRAPQSHGLKPPAAIIPPPKMMDSPSNLTSTITSTEPPTRGMSQVGGRKRPRGERGVEHGKASRNGCFMSKGGRGEVSLPKGDCPPCPKAPRTGGRRPRVSLYTLRMFGATSYPAARHLQSSSQEKAPPPIRTHPDPVRNSRSREKIAAANKPSQTEGPYADPPSPAPASNPYARHFYRPRQKLLATPNRDSPDSGEQHPASDTFPTASGKLASRCRAARDPNFLDDSLDFLRNVEGAKAIAPLLTAIQTLNKEGEAQSERDNIDPGGGSGGQNPDLGAVTPKRGGREERAAGAAATGGKGPVHGGTAAVGKRTAQQGATVKTGGRSTAREKAREGLSKSTARERDQEWDSTGIAQERHQEGGDRTTARKRHMEGGGRSTARARDLEGSSRSFARERGFEQGERSIAQEKDMEGTARVKGTPSSHGGKLAQVQVRSIQEPPAAMASCSLGAACLSPASPSPTYVSPKQVHEPRSSASRFRTCAWGPGDPFDNRRPESPPLHERLDAVLNWASPLTKDHPSQHPKHGPDDPVNDDNAPNDDGDGPSNDDNDPNDADDGLNDDDHDQNDGHNDDSNDGADPNANLTRPTSNPSNLVDCSSRPHAHSAFLNNTSRHPSTHPKRQVRQSNWVDWSKSPVHKHQIDKSNQPCKQSDHAADQSNYPVDLVHHPREYPRYAVKRADSPAHPLYPIDREQGKWKRWHFWEHSSAHGFGEQNEGKQGEGNQSRSNQSRSNQNGGNVVLDQCKVSSLQVHVAGGGNSRDWSEGCKSGWKHIGGDSFLEHGRGEGNPQHGASRTQAQGNLHDNGADRAQRGASHHAQHGASRHAQHGPSHHAQHGASHHARHGASHHAQQGALHHAQQPSTDHTQQHVSNHGQQPRTHQAQQPSAQQAQQPSAQQAQQHSTHQAQQSRAHQAQQSNTHQAQQPSTHHTQQPSAHYAQQPSAQHHCAKREVSPLSKLLRTHPQLQQNTQHSHPTAAAAFHSCLHEKELLSSAPVTAARSTFLLQLKERMQKESMQEQAMQNELIPSAPFQRSCALPIIDTAFPEGPSDKEHPIKMPILDQQIDAVLSSRSPPVTAALATDHPNHLPTCRQQIKAPLQSYLSLSLSLAPQSAGGDGHASNALGPTGMASKQPTPKAGPTHSTSHKTTPLIVPAYKLHASTSNSDTKHSAIPDEPAHKHPPWGGPAQKTIPSAPLSNMPARRAASPDGPTHTGPPSALASGVPAHETPTPSRAAHDTPSPTALSYSEPAHKNTSCAFPIVGHKPPNAGASTTGSAHTGRSDCLRRIPPGHVFPEYMPFGSSRWSAPKKGVAGFRLWDLPLEDVPLGEKVTQLEGVTNAKVIFFHRTTGEAGNTEVQLTSSCHMCQSQHFKAACRTGILKMQRNKEPWRCGNSMCRTCVDRHCTHSFEELVECCARCRGVCPCRQCLRDNSGYVPPCFSIAQQGEYGEHLLRCCGPLLMQEWEKELKEVELGGLSLPHVPCATAASQPRPQWCSVCATGFGNLVWLCHSCGWYICLECRSELVPHPSKETRQSKSCLHGSHVMRTGNASTKRVAPSSPLGKQPRGGSNKMDVDGGDTTDTGKWGGVQGNLNAGRYDGAEGGRKTGGSYGEGAGWKLEGSRAAPCCPNAACGGIMVLKRLISDLDTELVKKITEKYGRAEYCPWQWKGRLTHQSLFHEETLSGMTLRVNEWDAELPVEDVRVAGIKNGQPFFIYTPHASRFSPCSPFGESALLLFQLLWKRGEPVLVRGLRSRVRWDPETMSRAIREPGNKSQGVAAAAERVLHARDAHQQVHELTQSRLFKLYMEPLLDCMLQVTGWPTNDTLGNRLKRHHQDFLEQLPLVEYTHPGKWDNSLHPLGPLNTAAHLPPSDPPTDLGPRTHIGFGRVPEDGVGVEGDCVIKLQQGRGDSVTLMLHACYHANGDREVEKAEVRHGGDVADPEQDPSYGCAGAVWDVFLAPTEAPIRAYLQRHLDQFRHTGRVLQEGAVEDVILGRCAMLNTPHRQWLEAEEGVVSFHFEQHPGEAVMIPCGCLYQSRNLRSCIKASLDFLSPESMTRALQLCNSLRDPRVGANVPPPHCRLCVDKLQPRAALLHGCVSAYTHLQQL